MNHKFCDSTKYLSVRINPLSLTTGTFFNGFTATNSEENCSPKTKTKKLVFTKV